MNISYVNQKAGFHQTAHRHIENHGCKYTHTDEDADPIVKTAVKS